MPKVASAFVRTPQRDERANGSDKTQDSSRLSLTPGLEIRRSTMKQKRFSLIKRRPTSYQFKTSSKTFVIQL
jgi:hypothetical protein